MENEINETRTKLNQYKCLELTMHNEYKRW